MPRYSRKHRHGKVENTNYRPTVVRTLIIWPDPVRKYFFLSFLFLVRNLEAIGTDPLFCLDPACVWSNLWTIKSFKKLFYDYSQAVELDSMEADQLTTSMLDDVFFIIKKCVKRAIGKSRHSDHLDRESNRNIIFLVFTLSVCLCNIKPGSWIRIGFGPCISLYLL